ncbi:hypothetical protein ACH5RR_021280 [Cinchona calisaya]|uniref:Uncharacterized protein n=1 Tax=Cinchona calisaya TaxID=153742 RepID=A0ABD2ZGU6_9GENT
MRKFPNIRELKCELNLGEIAESTEDTDMDVAFNLLSRLESLKLIHSYATYHNIEYLCLEELVLLECNFLTEVPCCLSYISTLETIEVIKCSDYLTRLVREIEEEQMSIRNEDLKVHIISE